ncbi:MAG: DUF4266 domain-containing protein [Deltaproteobacteria bacterium]|nr:DUF4266 domain-containing protein [Deltaproteobacteria bacterium]
MSDRTRSRWRPILAILVALATSWLSACATTRPWEREDLARSAMAPDPDPDRDALRRHFLTTREGAGGALGAGGGGCGCN